jgi:RNA polymerase sigma factor (sigma-70 family)
VLLPSACLYYTEDKHHEEDGTMDGKGVGVLLRHIRRLTAAGTPAPAPDAELLECFAAQHDEAAFAALVRRHGAMVLGVCRRVLKDWHEAEDTFQAAFLVLARKAGSVRRRGSLASWLYAVAYHLAVRARANAARRASLAGKAARKQPVDPLTEISGRELLEVLDQEVRRLPEKLRAPVVLCYLEAHTQDEAARQLGWTEGTLRGRLERGRELLRSRLARRGVTLSAALLVTALSRGAADAVVPPALAVATVRAAAGVLADPAVHGAASVRVAALAERSLPEAVLGKVKLVALLLAAGVMATVTSALVLQPLPEDQAAAGREDDRRAGQQEAAPPPVRADLFGDPLPPGALTRFGTVRLRQGAPGGSGFEAVLFAPDGKSVASLGGHDPSIRLWDVRTGKPIRTFGAGSASGQLCMAFAPDRRTLASGGAGGVIHLWRTETGKEVRSFRGHTAQITVLAFSPDGALLAVVSSPKNCPSSGPGRKEDHAIRLFEAATGKELRRFEGHQAWVNAVAFSPDGRLASGSDDGTVRLWDVGTGRETRQVSKGRQGVESVAFSPDGKLLASGPADDRSVRLWEVKTGREVRALRGHSENLRSLIFSADGRRLASTAPDAIRLWDVATGREVHRFLADIWGARSVAFSPDGKTLAASGPTVRLWDVATAKELLPLAGHQTVVCSTAFSPTGKLVASAGYDRTIRLWDAATGKEVRTLRGHAGGIRSIAFAPDGRALVSIGPEDGTIRLWDVTTGKELRRFVGAEEKGGVSLVVAFSPDGKLLAAGGSTIRLWDVAGGRELRRLQGHEVTASLAFSPDGRTLASEGGHDRTLCLWDVGSGRELRRCRIREDYFSCVAFSPDGKTVASGSPGLVRLWEVATAGERCAAKGPAAGVLSLAFSPDGKALAAGGWDGAVHLWDAATGKRQGTFAGHQGAVWSVAFAPDGKTLVSSSQDTTALVWDVTRRAPAKGAGPARLSAEEVKALWDDLASGEAAVAYRAVLALAAAPESVSLLREQLRPVATHRRGEVAGWLVDLGSDRFAVREKATEALEKIGDLAEPALEEALGGKPSLEVRRRLERLLAKLRPSVLPPGQLRLLRGVEVLERSGTAEARQLLAVLAGGAAQARLTREVRGALARLDRWPAP